MASLGLVRIKLTYAPKLQHSYVEFLTNFTAEIEDFSQFLPILHGYTTTIQLTNEDTQHSNIHLHNEISIINTTIHLFVNKLIHWLHVKDEHPNHMH
jgi:hypothetical protein